jgi:putative ABC transport system substrate-binding protein
MRRREFITLIAGAGAVWPLGARAQQRAPLRVGATSVQSRSVPIYVAFVKRMAELGYEDGKNFTFDFVQAPNVSGYSAATAIITIGRAPAAAIAVLKFSSGPVAIIMSTPRSAIS